MLRFNRYSKRLFQTVWAFLPILAITTNISFAQEQTPAQEKTVTEKTSAPTYIYNGRTITQEYFDAVNVARQALPAIKSGDYARAEPMMQRAAAVCSDDADILLNYALVLVKVGKAKEAIDYYNKAAAINPQLESCWIGLSSAYGTLGQLDESLKACNEFMKRFPNSRDFSSIKNQAATIERELKRLAKSNGESQSSMESDNYVPEAISTHGTKHTWNSTMMPLAVCIQSGESAIDWRPELNQVMKDAFLEWANSSNGALSFRFVDEPDSANIVCSWTDDTSKLKNPAEQGETSTRWSESNDLIRATIKMATKSPINPTSPLTSERVKQTALHEIGHALGIAGHSGNPKDVMYFANLNMANPALSQRDTKTLQLLYSAEAITNR